MTEEEIARSALCLLRPIGRKPCLDPVREKIKQMRIEYGDPAMTPVTMTGIALDEFIDFEHQFLVEQTGLRATQAKAWWPA